VQSSPTTALDQKQVHDRLVEALPEAGLAWTPGNVAATVVPVEHLHRVLERLRDDPSLAFDYPASITAVDYMDDFELIYQLRSMSLRQDAIVKCRVERDNAVAPSCVDLWPGADFQEREIYDLMGVVFQGHPNLQRILLWDEFVGHPLRRDFGIPAPLPAEVEQALSRGEILNPEPQPGPRQLDERDES
jgi:NADH-quinone oxidoreductase subunit C